MQDSANNANCCASILMPVPEFHNHGHRGRREDIWRGSAPDTGYERCQQ